MKNDMIGSKIKYLPTYKVKPNHKSLYNNDVVKFEVSLNKDIVEPTMKYHTIMIQTNSPIKCP